MPPVAARAQPTAALSRLQSWSQKLATIKHRFSDIIFAHASGILSCCRKFTPYVIHCYIRDMTITEHVGLNTRRLYWPSFKENVIYCEQTVSKVVVRSVEPQYVLQDSYFQPFCRLIFC